MLLLTVILSALVFSSASGTMYRLSSQGTYKQFNQTITTQVECMKLCSANDRCFGFALGLGQSNCYLYEIADNSTKEVIDPGMPFYERIDRPSDSPTVTTENVPTPMETKTTTIQVSTATTSQKSTTKPRVDPIFDQKHCSNANRSVFASQQPILFTDDPRIWEKCSKCSDNEGHYYMEQFTDLYHDTDNRYFVMVNGKGNKCDLLVQCYRIVIGKSISGSLKFHINGAQQKGPSFVLRITWDGNNWTSENDLKRINNYQADLPNIVDTIDCS